MRPTLAWIMPIESEYPVFPSQLPMPGGPGAGSNHPVFPGQLPMPGGPTHGGPVDPGFGVLPPVDPSWGVKPPLVDPGYGRPGVGHGHVDNTLPLPPGSTAPPGQIYPPITELHTKSATLAWLPGYGYRWITVDPVRPDQVLPPTGAPKK